MKVLLDNNMPKMLRRILVGHIVIHAYDAGWATLSNGNSIRVGERDGFEVLITNDKKMHKQQNNEKRRIALVVLNSNSRKGIRAAHDRVVKTVEESTPGGYAVVEIEAS